MKGSSVLSLLGFLCGALQTADAQCEGQINCGGHCASSCEVCGGPKGSFHPHGFLWCNGECTYQDYGVAGDGCGVCYKKGTPVPPKPACPAPQPAPAPGGPAPAGGGSHQWMCGTKTYCGGHCADSCTVCGGPVDADGNPTHAHGFLWCNGDCEYHNEPGLKRGKCVPKTKQRLFDAEQAAVPQRETGMSAWALPLFGILTMFSLAAFFAVRRRAKACAGQLRIPEQELVSEDDTEGVLE